MQHHGQESARLLCLWNSLGKNTRVGSHFLLQGIFLTQGSNLCLSCLLNWQVGSLPLVPPGKPSNIVCAVLCLVTQFCLTLYDPVDHAMGILQARILEWVAISFSRGSSWPRDRTCISSVSWIGRWVLYRLSHQGSLQLISLFFLQISVLLEEIPRRCCVK